MTKSVVKQEQGQMAVELAAVIPVMIILALISVNLLVYMSDCTRFDRLAEQAVRTEAVSPSYTEYGAKSSEQRIKSALEEQFASADYIQIEVESSDRAVFSDSLEVGDGLIFSLIPTYREYTCTMTFTAPFFPNGVFGLSLPTTTHTCTLVVDPFEPGGWG